MQKIHLVQLLMRGFGAIAFHTLFYVSFLLFYCYSRRNVSISGYISLLSDI